MKKIFSLLFAFLLALPSQANDGVFYAAGNHLIPIMETDISVTKEILTITREGDYAIVDVYYEFFNPTKQKNLLVGFEAPPPYNSGTEVDEMLKGHPFITDFSTLMNGEKLAHQITIVRSDSNYYKNGNWDVITQEDLQESREYYDGLMGIYVYYFHANFQPGKNIIRHRYKCRLSMVVGIPWQFFYTLTTANRWANRQIDDFTLNIDMGKCTTFSIPNDFFTSMNEWKITGKGRCADTLTPPYWDWREYSYAVFHMQEGGITFHKNNFHPNGELTIEDDDLFWNFVGEEIRDTTASLLEYARWKYFDAIDYAGLNNAMYYLLNPEGDGETFPISKFTKEERKIFRNLPFAYRGYVFKDKKLQQYFESTRWYLPDPTYNGSEKDFSEKEIQWVKHWE